MEVYSQYIYKLRHHKTTEVQTAMVISMLPGHIIWTDLLCSIILCYIVWWKRGGCYTESPVLGWKCWMAVIIRFYTNWPRAIKDWSKARGPKSYWWQPVIAFPSHSTKDGRAAESCFALVGAHLAFDQSLIDFDQLLKNPVIAAIIMYSWVGNSLGFLHICIYTWDIRYDAIV